MKVWSCVEMFDGVITDMKVFPTIECARKHFHNYIKNNGTIDDCDSDWYQDGYEGSLGDGFFYWNDGNDGIGWAEITIWPTEMNYTEMEG